MTDRTLLQQALACVVNSTEYRIGNPAWEQCEAALRARLAEPERTVTLPPLPEPLGFLEPTGRSPAFHYLARQNEDGMPVYTPDQMRDYARAALRARLAERCPASHLCDCQEAGIECVLLNGRENTYKYRL